LKSGKNIAAQNNAREGSVFFFANPDTSLITIYSIKRKENLFSLVFLAREQKNSGKKFFLFIGHEVLFYETPFLHRPRRNCLWRNQKAVRRSQQ
jgi:hypothetical protein